MMYLYDLRHAPASFDFLTWLANCATDAQGEFDVGIKPGPARGFRADSLDPQDYDSRMALLENVMLPMLRLYPIRRAEVFTEQEGRHQPYLLNGLFTGKPVISMTVPQWALARVRRRFPVPPVVFSLRQTPYQQSRNSNLPEWNKAKADLESRGHTVVIVGDGFDSFEWDSIILRAALFEHAKAVLGVNSGNMGLALFNERVRYSILKPVSGEVATSEEWWETRMGTPRGADFPFAMSHQKIWWHDDTAENIVAAFDALPPKCGGAFPPAAPKHKLIGFKSGLNTSTETMMAQAEQNLKRDLPLFIEHPEHGGEALIVGGGPSLADTLPNLRMHRQRGGIVFALNGAHDWLIERGIVPDFHVMLDAREENARFVLEPNPKCTYLIAAQCHPAVFDALEGQNVMAWVSCLETPEHEHALAAKFLGKPLMMIGGGATVGLKAMNLAYLWGFRRMRFYGFDSSYRGDENHAYRQTLNDGESRMQIHAAGRDFICAPWMAKQAQEFQRQYRQLTDLGCRISVHGDGLIPHIAKQLKQETHHGV
jgi:uncharacterized Rossmann fold enzyme